MAKTGTLHDAFIDELRDTYDAEKQLVKALPKLARAASSRSAAKSSRRR
jgi:ferritin-like metal-binding protein YciE